jgi:high-affinity K+ transport system ATPase subunit B
MCVQVVPNIDLVVGDVLLVNMGDKVVADGVMIDGFHLVVDEASLTGVWASPACTGRRCTYLRSVRVGRMCCTGDTSATCC